MNKLFSKTKKKSLFPMKSNDVDMENEIFKAIKNKTEKEHEEFSFPSQGSSDAPLLKKQIMDSGEVDLFSDNENDNTFVCLFNKSPDGMNNSPPLKAPSVDHQTNVVTIEQLNPEPPKPIQQKPMKQSIQRCVVNTKKAIVKPEKYNFVKPKISRIHLNNKFDKIKPILCKQEKKQMTTPSTTASHCNSNIPSQKAAVIEKKEMQQQKITLQPSVTPTIQQPKKEEPPPVKKRKLEATPDELR